MACKCKKKKEVKDTPKPQKPENLTPEVNKDKFYGL